MVGFKQSFILVALFFSLVGFGCAEEGTKSIDFSKSLVDLPLHKGAWNIETDQKNSPTPTVNFDEGVITISGMKPLENHYPTVSIWSEKAPKISPETSYIMEVEARVDTPERNANILFGINVVPGEGNGHWFQHWHMLMEHKKTDYRGDWSEIQCLTKVDVDKDYHKFRLELDREGVLKYFFDEKLICEQANLPFPASVKPQPKDLGTFRIFFQRYPENADSYKEFLPTVGKISETYTLQIRRFAVKVLENSN